MSEEFDFSELRNYLEGQMALGESELFLDEPWTLTRKPMSGSRPAIPGRNPPPIPPVRPVSSVSASPVPRQAPISAAPAAMVRPSVPATPAAPAAPTAMSPVSAPTPRVAKRTASAYESAATLQDFYASLKAEPLYAHEPDIVRYVGPEHPKYLFLLPAVKPGTDPAAFFQSPVGEMLIRLFASLHIAQEDLGVTYFFKSGDRPLAPLLETALKKMLTKELSFIAPGALISFGEPLFHKLFGRSKNFEELAGSDLEFAGFKTCALVDPYAMVNDKQMKWLTWKVHIPRSTLFTAK